MRTGVSGQRGRGAGKRGRYGRQVVTKWQSLNQIEAHTHTHRDTTE